MDVEIGEIITTKGNEGTFKGLFKKVKQNFSNKESRIPTAHEAYFKSKYGDISSLEEYIAIAQDHVNAEIRRNMVPRACAASTEDKFSSHYAMVTFDDDIVPFVDTIFAPFIENGFRFIPLKGVTEELSNANIWIISWNFIEREVS